MAKRWEEDGRSNSGDWKMCEYCLHWYDNVWKSKKEAEATRTEFNIVLISQDEKFFNSGFFKVIQDTIPIIFHYKTLIPTNFFGYIYFVGCVVCLYSAESFCKRIGRKNWIVISLWAGKRSNESNPDPYVDQGSLSFCWHLHMLKDVNQVRGDLFCWDPHKWITKRVEY